MPGCYWNLSGNVNALVPQVSLHEISDNVVQDLRVQDPVHNVLLLWTQITIVAFDKNLVYGLLRFTAKKNGKNI